MKKSAKRPTTRAAREAARVKTGRGRPAKLASLRKASIVIEEKQYRWLKAQPKGISATVRDLIKREMGS